MCQYIFISHMLTIMMAMDKYVNLIQNIQNDCLHVWPTVLFIFYHINDLSTNGWHSFRNFSNSFLWFVTVTRSRAVDLQKKQTSRSVFQCYVFGCPGVGKVQLYFTNFVTV